MSRTRRRGEDYFGKNKPSKRFAKCFDKYWFKSKYYEVGSCGAYGHTTRSADNQSLNQQVRTREKREWKKEIKNEIEENN